MSTDFLYPLRRIHGFLHDQRERRIVKRNILRDFKEKQKKNPKTLFLVLTPEHGNLGDHAIALAITNMLFNCGIDYIEITTKQLQGLKQNKILNAFNKYPILVNGGGNLGTLWMDVENVFRQLIIKNPKSKIICLPNTIFYGSTSSDQEEFKKSKAIYNRHKELYLYAREKTSYDFMKRAYKNVSLVPDMVLSLNRSDSCEKRRGCLLCLRNDCERTRTELQEQQIREQAEQLFGEMVYDTDMILKRSVSVAEREAVLQAKFEDFAKASLVITDRLHGMIFCAITGTPCIVVDSKSPKVRGCYEWIKDLDYIRFVEQPSEIVQAYRSIPNTMHRYDGQKLWPYYKKLASDILEILNWK